MKSTWFAKVALTLAPSAQVDFHSKIGQIAAHRTAPVPLTSTWGLPPLRTVDAGQTLAAAVWLACALVAAPVSPASANAAVAHEIAENAPAESFETFLDRLMSAESGGHSNAKNPRSSALGTFQFIKSTFLEIARRHFRAEVDGFVEDKILALRTDRAFARRAAAAFCRDNIGYLKAQGLSPTFADLRLAFLLGPADAARVMKAEPQTPAVQMLSPLVIKANPFMERMSGRPAFERHPRCRAGPFAADRSRTPTTAAPRSSGTIGCSQISADRASAKGQLQACVLPQILRIAIREGLTSPGPKDVRISVASSLLASFGSHVDPRAPFVRHHHMIWTWHVDPAVDGGRRREQPLRPLRRQYV